MLCGLGVIPPFLRTLFLACKKEGTHTHTHESIRVSGYHVYPDMYILTPPLKMEKMINTSKTHPTIFAIKSQKHRGSVVHKKQHVKYDLHHPVLPHPYWDIEELKACLSCFETQWSQGGPQTKQILTTNTSQIFSAEINRLLNNQVAILVYWI